MISKSEYLKAKRIVEIYESQLATLQEWEGKVTEMFPIGCKVNSTKTKSVVGRVVGYGAWNGIPSLLLDTKGKVLCTNAKKL